MKKRALIYLVIAIACLLFAESCKKNPANTTPPSVKFTNPAANGSVLRTTLFSVNVTAAANKKIRKVVFFVDGQPISNGTVTNPPWQVLWECTGQFGQPRVIKAVATDDVGITGVDSVIVTPINAVEKAKMPTARYAFTSNVINGKIYVVGGYNDNLTAFFVVEEYDPATDTWTTKAPPLTGHAAHASCVINNILYVFGGDKGYDWTDSVEAYDPVANSWSRKAPIPQDSLVSIGMNTAAEANGKAYLMGGLASPEPARVAEYNPVTDTWRPTNTYQRQYIAEAVTISNTIYFLGGCPFRAMGFCDNPSDSIQAYDAIADNWIAKKNMIYGHSGQSATVLNNKIYVFGGVTTDQAAPNKASEVYDPVADNWTALAPLPWDLVNYGCNALNGVIYIIGSDHVYEYTPD